MDAVRAQGAGCPISGDPGKSGNPESGRPGDTTLFGTAELGALPTPETEEAVSWRQFLSRGLPKDEKGLARLVVRVLDLEGWDDGGVQDRLAVHVAQGLEDAHRIASFRKGASLLQRREYR